MQAKVYKIGNKLGIYFPRNKQFYTKGEIVLLKIIKNSKKVYFIVAFNYNIIIRGEFVKILDLKEKDSIFVKIEKINNLSRTKNIFFGNNIDLLSLIPNKTLKGYEIIVSSFFRSNVEWIRLWYYHSRGSGRQLEIKRFVDIESFGKLLGQYQAEGTKKSKNRFRLEFCNKLVKEHEDYLESLSKLGINKNMLEFHFVYNPDKLFNDKLMNYINEFTYNIQLPVKRVQNKASKGVSFRNVIRNVLLTEIIINFLDIIRKYLANKNEYNELEEKLAGYFFSKLVTGDGTLDISIKNRESNYPYTRLKVVDKNLEYLKDYQKIMDKLGFSAKIVEKNILVKAGVPFNKLVYLYQIEAFKNTNNWNKLIVLIEIYLNGRRFNTNYRFLNLINYRIFTNKHVAKDFGLSYSAALDWLYNKEIVGFVKRLKSNKNIINWKLTNNAINFVYFIKIWHKDLIKLKEEKQIQDPNRLLESLKIKFVSPEEGTQTCGGN